MATLLRLSRALELLDGLKDRGDMTTSLARTFIAVAEEEGVSGKDLETRLGMSQGSVSRHLLDLGHRNRRFEPGLALVEWRLEEKDYRAKKWVLTAEGRKVRDRLRKLMEA
jgi:DNA-binding MarR family transcriptional regulator